MGGVYASSDTVVTINNSVFWGNTDNSGSGESAQLSVSSSSSTLTVNHCCIQGLSAYSGNSNFDNDPFAGK